MRRLNLVLRLAQPQLLGMTSTHEQTHQLVAMFYARLEAEPQIEGHPFDRDAEKRSLERHGVAAAQWFKMRAGAAELETVKADLKTHLTIPQPLMGLEALRVHLRRLAVAQAALDELRREETLSQR